MDADLFKASHLIGIIIIAVLAVYSYYLSWKVDNLKYELANKELELNLCKVDKSLVESKLALWQSKIKEMTVRLASKLPDLDSRLSNLSNITNSNLNSK